MLLRCSSWYYLGIAVRFLPFYFHSTFKGKCILWTSGTPTTWTGCRTIIDDHSVFFFLAHSIRIFVIRYLEPQPQSPGIFWWNSRTVQSDRQSDQLRRKSRSHCVVNYGHGSRMPIYLRLNRLDVTTLKRNIFIVWFNKLCLFYTTTKFCESNKPYLDLTSTKLNNKQTFRFNNQLILMHLKVWNIIYFST